MEKLTNPFRADLYRDDLPVVRLLGLNANADIDTREWVDLGIAREPGEDFEVHVSVLAMPAQFWRFDIVKPDADGRAIRIATGSGTLSRYWPIVKDFATGMLTAEPIPEKAAVEVSPPLSGE